MSKRKPNQFLELALSDDGSTVKVALGDGTRTIVDFENVEASPVRVHAPLPVKEQLLSNAQYFAGNKKLVPSVPEWIERYIKSREKEIYDQVQEIRRNMKRMNQCANAVRIAKELLAANIK